MFGLLYFVIFFLSLQCSTMGENTKPKITYYYSIPEDEWNEMDRLNASSVGAECPEVVSISEPRRYSSEELVKLVPNLNTIRPPIEIPDDFLRLQPNYVSSANINYYYSQI